MTDAEIAAIRARIAGLRAEARELDAFIAEQEAKSKGLPKPPRRRTRQPAQPLPISDVDEQRATGLARRMGIPLPRKP